LHLFKPILLTYRIYTSTSLQRKGIYDLLPSVLSDTDRRLLLHRGSRIRDNQLYFHPTAYIHTQTIHCVGAFQLNISRQHSHCHFPVYFSLSPCSQTIPSFSQLSLHLHTLPFHSHLHHNHLGILHSNLLNSSRHPSTTNILNNLQNFIAHYVQPILTLTSRVIQVDHFFTRSKKMKVVALVAAGAALAVAQELSSLSACGVSCFHGIMA
jgi:hypothetical protein